MNNDYVIRQLEFADFEQFQKLTADSYYPDTDFAKAFDMTYQDFKDFSKTIDFQYFVDHGVGFGAFFKDQLVSCITSADVLNFGPEQEKSQKASQFMYITEYCTKEFEEQSNFLPGQCYKIIFLQTHPDHREKGLAKLVFTQCFEQLKKKNVKWILLEAVHIATKKILFSLSKKQHVLNTNEQFNGKKFWLQGLAIEIE
ncbi:hypothetical protein pb186bvf_001843 [Paramecium bursaria]